MDRIMEEIQKEMVDVERTFKEFGRENPRTQPGREFRGRAMNNLAQRQKALEVELEGALGDREIAEMKRILGKYAENK